MGKIHIFNTDREYHIIIPNFFKMSNYKTEKLLHFNTIIPKSREVIKVKGILF
jgi:hypothetical protein